MSNEAIEYARALAAELNHLDERWETASRTITTLDREVTTAREKLLEVVKGLGGTVVVGNKVYMWDVAMTDRLVVLEAVIAGQQQGQGYYDPAKQSTVRWYRLGDILPADNALVLALPRGYKEGVSMLYCSADKEWENWAGDRTSTSTSDLWAEWPQPPREESTT